jgi:hypothetical protein
MMDVKTLIDRNFSRKAELVVVTEITLIMLARSLTGEVEPGVAKEIVPVVRLAMWIVGVVGLAGILAQAIIDLKWPKHRNLENLLRRVLTEDKKAAETERRKELRNEKAETNQPPASDA